MHWICYLRKKTLYLPTQALVKSGPYVIVDPLFMSAIDDAEGIRSALKEVVTRGNPIITEAQRQFYNTSLLEKAGVQSWGAFAKGAFCWDIDKSKGYYRIIGQRKMRPRGWTDDPSQIINLQPGATIDDLCDQVIAVVQAKAAEQ